MTVTAKGKEKEKGKDNQELNAFGGASGLVLVAPSLVEPRGTAEPTQIHSEADEGAKGVMMVDSPPHQPQKKSSYYMLLLKSMGTVRTENGFNCVGSSSLAVPVSLWVPLILFSVLKGVSVAV